MGDLSWSQAEKRVTIEEFVTGQDTLTPQDALRRAIEAIDAGALSRRVSPMK
jgi:hypothetical protein